ncbi:MAG: two-component sensor histidine kinase [Tenericutes bacterium HGW-Tenericutes-3]|nr:MAG: two-component sensor histidine kinase [Tenericutes bacterium HGW-Tenericutes-3]
MKKLSVKIIVASFLIFAVTTIIPRITFMMFKDLPAQDIVQSDIFLLAMALTAILSLTLFMLAMKYMIINRVRTISYATKQIAQGNFDLQVSVKGKDEISSLSADFNQMVHELKANEYLNKEFVRNFSHEFKTPMSAIKGYAELISQGNLSKEEVYEYSNIIAVEASRLSNLSKNMLQISILDSTSIVKIDQEFNVSEQIRSVIQMMQLMWEKKNIELNIDIEEIQMVSNKELTYEIWKNLIDNAIKYTPENEKIDISLKCENKNIIFEITNYGISIPQSDQEHIYDLFYVVEKSRLKSSSGIGLSITKRIVDKLNGKIYIESGNESKTTFKVVLPKTLITS